MAGSAKTIMFASRQSVIPSCVIVTLYFTEGELRAEYISGSELDNGDGTWSYTFLVQEDDLPGSLNLEDVTTCNVIAPYWTCLEDDEEEDEDEECAVRNVTCFSGVPVVEELTENDYVAILRFDAECEIYCLRMMTPTAFKEALDALEA